MSLKQLLNLKIGDIIFVAINKSMVSKYQYIGIFTEHTTHETKRVFLSPFFLSTISIRYGREEKSIMLKNIFLTENEAKERAKEMQSESIYQ